MVIGRGRRREHPQPTMFTTTGVAQLPVTHAYNQWNPERGGQVTLGHIR
jgi:hypothetical protein